MNDRDQLARYCQRNRKPWRRRAARVLELAGWLLLAAAVVALFCGDLFGQVTYQSIERRGLLGLRRKVVYWRTDGAHSTNAGRRVERVAGRRAGGLYYNGCGANCIRPTPPAIDYRRLADTLARDPRFRGPPGPPGTPGRNGRPATLTDDDREQIAGQVTKRLAEDFQTRAIPLDKLADQVRQRIGEATTPAGLADLRRRVDRLERAPITIEQFDAAGRLESQQSRTLVGEGAEPFYFGTRSRRPARQLFDNATTR